MAKRKKAKGKKAEKAVAEVEETVQVTETEDAPEQQELVAESEISAELEEDSDVVVAEREDEEAVEGLDAQAEDYSEDTLEVSAEEIDAEAETIEADVAGTELDEFESAQIEDLEMVEEVQLDSIVESMLFASDKPVSMATIRTAFKGTNIKTDHIRKSLKRLEMDLADGRRGVSLEEAPGGYQIRTKQDNLKFLTRSVKTRFFKLSGPALEVLAIAAYKQPVVKAEIDEIRGVESGHLLRALMEKGLVSFEGKSELPGRPMQYATTKKFLEIFGLRNLRELPTLSQIDELLPDGIGEDEEADKPKLADITDKLSEQVGVKYSEGEDELVKITEQLQDITVTSDFFEQEKQRQKAAREAERARNIREALMVGEKVPTRDRNWLERYDEALKAGTAFVEEGQADRSVEGLVSSAASIFKDSGFAEGEQAAEVRFEEEEDISLDGDLNVDRHDDEGEAEA